ncbi:MAG: hypothetical protein ABIL76_07970 [candidate division WOR-3 bacterium]
MTKLSRNNYELLKEIKKLNKELLKLYERRNKDAINKIREEGIEENAKAIWQEKR